MIPNICDNGRAEARNDYTNFAASIFTNMNVEKCVACKRGYELSDYSVGELEGRQCVETECSCENGAPDMNLKGVNCVVSTSEGCYQTVVCDNYFTPTSDEVIECLFCKYRRPINKNNLARIFFGAYLFFWLKIKKMTKHPEK